MSFDDARNKCEEIGFRLCTKHELLSELCCGKGGGCDHYLVWTSTLETGMHWWNFCYEIYVGYYDKSSEDNYLISIYFSKGKYFLGRQGRKYCRGGKTITDVTTCQNACKHLNIPIGVAAGDLVAGTVCFKNGLTGKCNQRSEGGEKAYMICEKGNVLRRSIFWSFKSNYQYRSSLL